MIYRFIDLFAGCGGLSLGLSRAGLQGVMAVEKDPMAFRTFSANFLEEGRRPVANFDWPSAIARRPWQIDELLERHWDDLVAMRNQVHVIAGGPPCQGFSTAGRRNEADPRNQLFRQYARVVDAIRPRAVVLENVPGMRIPHAADARGESESYYEKAKALLERIGGVDRGYHVDHRILNADQFGVPQRRPRLILIGIRNDLGKFLHNPATRAFEALEQGRLRFLRRHGLEAPVPVSDAISDLRTSRLQPCRDQDPPGFSEAVYEGPQTTYQRLMNAGREGAPMDSMRLARHGKVVAERFARILDEVRPGVRMNDEDRKKFNLLKHRVFLMAAGEPAPTMTTLPDDVLHYGEPRILTVREIARIQSFPDWFVFKGKYTTGGELRTRQCPRYTQVGNAVPPLLAQAIGEALVATISECEAFYESGKRERAERDLEPA